MLYPLPSPTTYDVFRLPASERGIADDALPVTTADNWKIYISPDGYPYHYNHATGESEWVVFNTPGSQIKVNSEPIVLAMISVPNSSVATAIGKALVEKRIVASAQVFPSSTIIYRNQDTIQQSNEVVLVLKVPN